MPLDFERRRVETNSNYVSITRMKISNLMRAYTVHAQAFRKLARER